MAQISLKINTNKKSDSSFVFMPFSEINNVSLKQNEKSTQNDGVNGISFATGLVSLKNGFLGNGGRFQSEKLKYNGYMFGATDKDGNFNLKLTLKGNNINRIVVYFDKNANQFATEAILNGEKTIYSDDPIWAIDFGKESSSQTVEFTKWNRANYNACFTFIQIMVEYLELNKSWINNLESLSQSTTNNELISYGIVPNTGSVNLLDINGELIDYINDKIIDTSYIPIQLFINGVKKQHHITTNTDYDEDSLSVNIHFSDDTSYLDGGKIVIDDEKKLVSMSAYELFFDTLQNKLTPKIGNVSTNGVLPYEVNTTKTVTEYLKNIKLNNLMLDINKTSAEIINDFCNISQLSFYKDKDNLPVLSFMRPIKPSDSLLSNGEKPIIIPEHYIISKDSSQVITNNKIKQVNIPVIENSLSYSSYKKFDNEQFKQTGIPYLSEIAFCETPLYENWVDFMEKQKGFKVYVSESNGSLFWYTFEINISLNEFIKFDSNKYGTSSYFITSYQEGSAVTTRKFDDVKVFKDINEFNKYLDVIKVPVYSGIIAESITDSFKDKFKVVFAFSVKIGPVGGIDPDNNKFRFWITANMDSDVEYSIVKRGEKEIVYTNPIENINSIKNEEIFTLQKNDFLTKDSTINCGVLGEIPLSKYIATSIYLDYANGVRTKKITIAYSDIKYYNNNQEIVIKIDDIKLGKYILLTDKYQNGNSIVWEITGINNIYDGEPLIQLELREVLEKSEMLQFPSFNLEDMSWEYISKLAQSGMADKYFKLGDYKKVKFTNPDYGEMEQFAYIVGFNQENLSDGSGKAGITFMMFSNIDSKMLSDSTTYASYENSIVRNLLNSEVIDSFDSDLKNAIRQVKKESIIYPTGSVVTNDKLWLPSATEIGKMSSYPTGDGVRYEYINDSVIKNISAGVRSWTRTALSKDIQSSPYMTNAFMVINPEYGNLSGANGYTSTESVIIGFSL